MSWIIRYVTTNTFTQIPKDNASIISHRAHQSIVSRRGMFSAIVADMAIAINVVVLVGPCWKYA